MKKKQQNTHLALTEPEFNNKTWRMRTLRATDCMFLVLTVLRLLKRCFGASWPLQFFTYMLQLNSPSLQPTRQTPSARLSEVVDGCVHLCCVITFRQQKLVSILLTPASWLYIPRVSVGPEVVAFWITIEVEPQPVTLDLERQHVSVSGNSLWWTGTHYALCFIFCRSKATDNYTP